MQKSSENKSIRKRYKLLIRANADIDAYNDCISELNKKMNCRSF